MLEINDILETISMIDKQHLDIRTVTMGISLFDCVSEDAGRLCDNIYDKITRLAGSLVQTGEDISRQYGIPIIHKRVAVTPVSLVARGMSPDDMVKIAKTLDSCGGQLRS